MALWKKQRRRVTEVAPDEIFADASNFPRFDTDRFEGRVEKPLARRTIALTGAALALIALAYTAQAWNLQIASGEEYAARALRNKLSNAIIFAERGALYDRAGRMLANNAINGDSDFSTRAYAGYRGIAHVIGYAKSPAKDDRGFYFRKTSIGADGVEAAYDSVLAGANGAYLTETDAVGNIVSESTVKPAENGTALTLSIDAALSQGLYDVIEKRVNAAHFSGGAAVIMDVQTGEMIALVSYPEFSPQIMADGTDTEAIAAIFADARQPFLDRATGGLYTPGSIVKPFIALGALQEGVVTEDTKILSTGSISIPNPYDPDNPSIFKDWRAHGWVDVRRAIAVSSDVYFYEVGGGFGSQKGIGIDNINTYMRMFGFGSATGLLGFTESTGTIPTPAWKEKMFDGDSWRLGDTYHTAIGQYGVTVTPLQAVRAVAAIANGGTLLTPTLLASSTPHGTVLPVDAHDMAVVREGMRMCVNDGGTAAAVNLGYVHVAAKTGTAQLGTRNQHMNSWIVGFFPYERPRYAFAIVLEKAPAGTIYGAPLAAFDFFGFLHENLPEYLE